MGVSQHRLYIDGLVQERCNYIANALELGLSCTNPSIWYMVRDSCWPLIGPKHCITPDSKVQGANMGPTWVLSAPDGPHVGPMNLTTRGSTQAAVHPKNGESNLHFFALHYDVVQADYIHILQGFFTGTLVVTWLPQCQGVTLKDMG